MLGTPFMISRCLSGFLAEISFLHTLPIFETDRQTDTERERDPFGKFARVFGQL